MQPTAPGDVVAEFIAAVERLDLDAALALLAPDVEYDNVPLGPVRGHAAVRATLGPFLERFDEVQWTVHHQATEGDVVLNERSDRFRAGDRWLELPVAGVFVVRDGHIHLWRDYFDRDTLMALFAALG